MDRPGFQGYWHGFPIDRGTIQLLIEVEDLTLEQALHSCCLFEILFRRSHKRKPTQVDLSAAAPLERLMLKAGSLATCAGFQKKAAVTRACHGDVQIPKHAMERGVSETRWAEFALDDVDYPGIDYVAPHRGDVEPGHLPAGHAQVAHSPQDRFVHAG